MMKLSAPLSRLVSFGSFVVAYAGVRYVVVPKYQNWRAESATTQVLDSLQTAAKATRAVDEGEIESLKRVTADAGNRRLDEMAPGAERRSAAADMFWGAYFLNTRGRVTYCKRLGVDVSPFVRSYERVNRDALDATRRDFQRRSWDPERLTPMLGNQQRSLLEVDMKEIAGSLQGSTTDACNLIADSADAVAELLLFSKMAPRAYRALMTGQ